MDIQGQKRRALDKGKKSIKGKIKREFDRNEKKKVLEKFRVKADAKKGRLRLKDEREDKE